MTMNRKHSRLVPGAVTAALVPLAFVLPLGLAGATPGSGVSSEVIASGSTDQPIHVRTKRPTDLVFARVTLQPDGYTGWHTHPGPLLVVVKSGTLTHHDRHCHVETYSAGQAFEEPAGSRHVHMGTNKSSVPVVLEVTYVVPASGPLRDEAPAPECASEL
jgi:quercetin dioxygenase-like cupin family protein